MGLYLTNCLYSSTGSSGTVMKNHEMDFFKQYFSSFLAYFDWLINVKS